MKMIAVITLHKEPGLEGVFIENKAQEAEGRRAISINTLSQPGSRCLNSSLFVFMRRPWNCWLLIRQMHVVMG